MARTAMSVLPATFYARDDVVGISRELLGKVLSTSVDGVTTKVLITETEAYAGVDDKASHAYGGRRTARTEPMFGPPGMAYVYLCYGIHHLFNVVTNAEDVPHAVLIRAGVPLLGVEAMLARRGRSMVDKALLGGPGSVAKALAITTAMTGQSLTGRQLRIEDHRVTVEDAAIEAGPRVGVDYAGEDAKRPYRFRINGADYLQDLKSGL